MCWISRGHVLFLDFRVLVYRVSKSQGIISSKLCAEGSWGKCVERCDLVESVVRMWNWPSRETETVGNSDQHHLRFIFFIALLGGCLWYFMDISGDFGDGWLMFMGSSWFFNFTRWILYITSIYPPVDWHNDGKSQLFVGKSTFPMAMFNSKL